MSARRRERRPARRALLRDLQPAGREPPARDPRSALNSRARRRAVVPRQGAADDRVRAVAARDRGARDVPEGSPRDEAGLGGRHPRLPRRLPAAEAPRDRARAARGLGARRRLDERARARASTSAASTSRCSLGYPGSVASTWQQAGRAGRRSGTSVAVLVANSTPLNQFVAKNPDYFFGAPVEQGRINPDNLQILVNHIKCAAFELPFADDERFGKENLAEILEFLEEQKLLHRAGDRWHWTSESYPADAVSLRSVSSDNFVVQDVTREPRIIAEVDYDSRAVDAPREGDLHPGGPHLLRREVRPRGAARRGARGRGRLLHRRDHLHEGAHPRPLRGGAARRRPAQPRRGARHLAGRGLQEDQVPHQRERRLGRAADARERDAHDLVLAHGAARADARAALHARGAARRRRRALLHARPAGGALPDVRPPRPRRRARRQRPGRGAHRARACCGSARRRAPAATSRRPATTTSRTSSSTTTTRAASASPSRSTGSTTGCSPRAARSSPPAPASDGCPSCVGPAGEVGSRGKEVALAILDAVRVPAA